MDISLTTPVLEVVMDSAYYPRGMALYGNDLYFTSIGGISKIDITQFSPTSDIVVPHVPGRDYFNLFILDDDLFVTDENAGHIDRIDLTQTNPQSEVVISGLDNPTGIGIYDNIVFHSALYGSGIIQNAISSIYREYSE